MSAPVTAIFGLGREVGEAVARRFAEAGHDVIAADPISQRVEHARANLDEDIVLHHGDLHTRLGIRNAFAVAGEAFGHVDNAVIVPFLPEGDSVADLKTETFEKALMRAARGAALTMRILAEHLADEDLEDGAGTARRRQRGTVTFILSQSGTTTNPGHFTESVTQAAVLGAMRAGALDLAEQRIRVNAICAIRPRAMDNEKWLKQRTPWGRAAQADEIADAALYLASPEAAIITGQTLTLDGGRSIFNGMFEK